MPTREPSSAWISVDMEGSSGVAADSHALMHGPDYERAHTKSLLSAVRIAPSAVPPGQ